MSHRLDLDKAARELIAAEDDLRCCEARLKDAGLHLDRATKRHGVAKDQLRKLLQEEQVVPGAEPASASKMCWKRVPGGRCRRDKEHPGDCKPEIFHGDCNTDWGPTGFCKLRHHIDGPCAVVVLCPKCGTEATGNKCDPCNFQWACHQGYPGCRLTEDHDHDP